MCVCVCVWTASDSPTHGKRVVGGDCGGERSTKQAKQHGKCGACGSFRRSDVRACPTCLDTRGRAACKDHLAPYGASAQEQLRLAKEEVERQNALLKEENARIKAQLEAQRDQVHCAKLTWECSRDTEHLGSGLGVLSDSSHSTLKPAHAVPSELDLDAASTSAQDPHADDDKMGEMIAVETTVEEVGGSGIAAKMGAVVHGVASQSAWTQGVEEGRWSSESTAKASDSPSPSTGSESRQNHATGGRTFEPEGMM